MQVGLTLLKIVAGLAPVVGDYYSHQYCLPPPCLLPSTPLSSLVNHLLATHSMSVPPMCCSQTSSFLSLHTLLKGSYMLHCPNMPVTVYSAACQTSHLICLSTSKFEHIICSSPRITSLFLLHFLSWIMPLSSIWSPNRISVVSSLTPLLKLCLFCLLFYLSILFTYFHSYHFRPCLRPGLP